MKSRLIATSMVAAAFVGMPCFADVYASGEVGYVAPVTTAPSTLTRAQVIAELEQAQREGTLPPTAEGADVGVMAGPRLDLVEPLPTLAAR